MTTADEDYTLSDGHGQFFSTGEGATTSGAGEEARVAARELEEIVAPSEREDFFEPLLQSLRMT